MPATISLGSTGDDVKRLQRVLARHLLWNPFGPITGTFDASLETSVKSFQLSSGLAVDGIVGSGNLGGITRLSRSIARAETGIQGACRGLASEGAQRSRCCCRIRPLHRCNRRYFRSRDRDRRANTPDLGWRRGERRRPRRYLVRLDHARFCSTIDCRRSLRPDQRFAVTIHQFWPVCQEMASRNPALRGLGPFLSLLVLLLQVRDFRSAEQCWRSHLARGC